MGSFQDKIGWKDQRKRENKNCRFVLFLSYPTRNRKFQKNIKKIQKIKKYHYGFIFSQNRCKMPWKSENKKTILKLWHRIKPKQVGKGREREKIKIIVPLRSYTTRNLKFQKNCNKIQKNKNLLLRLHFKPK